MSDLPPPPPPHSVPPPYSSQPYSAPPPGYVAYGGPGAVQGQFSPIGGLTKWLVALMAITLGVQVISLIVQFTLRDSATDFINDSISSSTFDDKLGLYLGISVLAGLVSLGQIVLLVIWTFRLAKNHQVLGRQPQTFGPGATIAVNILGGCTLGILNFFMWRELWKASDPATPAGDSGWKQNAVTPLLAIYLAVTLASVGAAVTLGITGAFGFQTGGNSNDLAENLNDRLGIVVLSGLLTVVTSAVFLIFVRQLSARHMAATREAAPL